MDKLDKFGRLFPPKSVRNYYLDIRISNSIDE